jgi:hypothetical protein
MLKFYSTILAALMATGLAVGCGSDSTTTSDQAATTTTENSGAATLSGTYIRTVSKADLARTANFRQEGHGQTPPPTGKYHLTFTGDTFTATDPNDFPVGQTYSATDAGQLSAISYVAPDQASFCSVRVPQVATYAWDISDGTLTLTAKQDKCADRDSILQGKWTRVGS